MATGSSNGSGFDLQSFQFFKRREERRFAEQRTTKYRVQARTSCIADARSYRVARRFPLLAIAQFDWKALIPTRRT
ncbi:MAG TPA: hypothetical protein VIR01_03785, partial [Pyrinomonadaceae bacterium]